MGAGGSHPVESAKGKEWDFRMEVHHPPPGVSQRVCRSRMCSPPQLTNPEGRDPDAAPCATDRQSARSLILALRRPQMSASPSPMPEQAARGTFFDLSHRPSWPRGQVSAKLQDELARAVAEAQNRPAIRQRELEAAQVPMHCPA